MRLFVILLALAAPACALRPPVTLDLYRGVLATHFDGIPDGSAVCAVLTNRGERAVEWVRLRLRAYPTHGERKGRWTSRWLFTDRLEPGETRTVELVRPPVAEQIELELLEAGSGPPAGRGRLVKPIGHCSEPSLREGLVLALGGGSDRRLAYVPIVRRGGPAPPVVVAREP
jgi:hypothetical protein